MTETHIPVSQLVETKTRFQSLRILTGLCLFLTPFIPILFPIVLFIINKKSNELEADERIGQHFMCIEGKSIKPPLDNLPENILAILEDIVQIRKSIKHWMVVIVLIIISLYAGILLMALYYK